MAVSRIYGPASDEGTPQFKVPSLSHGEQQKEALNDQRVTDFTSTWSFMTFLFKYMCHLIFTIPSQAAYLNEKS
jgi:hypothetical protein